MKIGGRYICPLAAGKPQTGRCVSLYSLKVQGEIVTTLIEGVRFILGVLSSSPCIKLDGLRKDVLHRAAREGQDPYVAHFLERIRIRHAKYAVLQDCMVNHPRVIEVLQLTSPNNSREDRRECVRCADWSSNNTAPGQQTTLA